MERIGNTIRAPHYLKQNPPVQHCPTSAGFISSAVSTNPTCIKSLRVCSYLQAQQPWIFLPLQTKTWCLLQSIIRARHTDNAQNDPSVSRQNLKHMFEKNACWSKLINIISSYTWYFDSFSFTDGSREEIHWSHPPFLSICQMDIDMNINILHYDYYILMNNMNIMVNRDISDFALPFRLSTS